MTKPYVGRFAPTPSGGLHLGSLVIALASYLDAKSLGGEWHVRIHDLASNTPVVGATQNILQTLELFGLEWDGEVFYQSQRSEIYEAVVAKLLNNGLAYACSCSRKELENYLIYPNFCRDTLKPRQEAAIRIRVPTLTYQFNDRVQGDLAQQLAEQVGDFIIQHKEGFIAYQLADVIDDAAQGITNIIRGADLLDSTPRQLYLQELLGYSSPSYLHVPRVLGGDGYEAGSSKCLPTLTVAQTSRLLLKALTLLGQSPELQLVNECPQHILDWAISQWKAEKIPPQRVIRVDNELYI